MLWTNLLFLFFPVDKPRFFMSFPAEFMYAITVILWCDAALLWRINFPLQILSALALILSIKGNALFYVRITKNRLILPYIKER